MERAVNGDPSGIERITGVAVPEGWVDEESWLLNYRFDQLRRDPTAGPWLLRIIVAREPQPRMIGYINFHGPPSPEGWAEVGYEILPPYRRQGYATEAVKALFDWAHREHGVKRFRASVSPLNEASLALIKRLGFGPVGTQWDERDGEEIVFERDWPPA